MSKEKGTLILSSKSYPNSASIYDVVRKKLCFGSFHNIKLKFSKKQDSWTKPGQVTSKLLDDGNGYNFIAYNINGEVVKNYRLDYCEASELRALLKLADGENATFNYIKKK